MSNTQESGRPRDPPATTFEPDPVVVNLLSESRPPYFGLALVTGWPPSPNMVESYNEFLCIVRQCFDSTDLTGEAPSVYLYHSDCLHVTVATLHPTEPTESKKEIDNGSCTNFQELETSWTQFMKRAMQRPGWPTAPLQFELDSCQIGARAGIILWRETTGGLVHIRSCLSQEAASSDSHLHIWGIPNIVHSTFLRFSTVPSTKGQLVQTKMQSFVPQVKNIFTGTFLAHNVKLVCERTPYMHIPNEEDHVLASIPLG